MQLILTPDQLSWQLGLATWVRFEVTVLSQLFMINQITQLPQIRNNYLWNS